MPLIIPPEGPRDAQIAIVGEAPGQEELMANRNFVGPSGQLLNQLLASTGIVRADCFVLNVVGEHPRDNDITPFFNLERGQALVTQRGKRWLYRLRWELNQCEANVIVALGKTAMFALTWETHITNFRGSILRSVGLEINRKVIPTFHPAYALRQQYQAVSHEAEKARGTYNPKWVIAADLVRAERESSFPDRIEPIRNWMLDPPFQAQMQFIKECHNLSEISLDIECGNIGRDSQVTCMSIAKNSRDVLCIPFKARGQNGFSLAQETDLWREIAILLADENVKKLGQNIIFDSSFLYRRYGIITRPVEDTMVAMGILYPEFPKGLGFICSIYTDEKYYKDDGKIHIHGYGKNTSERQFWLYNAKDSVVLFDAIPRIRQDLKTMGNLDAYDRQRRLIEPCIYMGEHGMKLDYIGMAAEQKVVTREVEGLIFKFREQCDDPTISHSSNKEVMLHFYGRRGIKAYRGKGKSSGPSVDETAVKRIARQKDKNGNIKYPEGYTLLAIRKLLKYKGTYLRMKIDETDFRLRGSFNVVGTTSGRLSSSKTLFGTGTNLQNLPARFRKFILADKGMILIEVDLAQAENRVIAYISPDANMINAFEKGFDLHSMTAALIFNKPMEDISHKQGSSTLGDGTHSERDWGKRANHAFNYDLGPSQFSLYYEVPNKDGKFLWSAYRQAYPGVFGSYYSRIREALGTHRTLRNLLGRSRRFYGEMGADLLKNAYSWPPQSTVAEKLNRDGVLLLYENQDQFPQVEMLNQIHDSVLFQVPVDMETSEMILILSSLKASLESPLTAHGREFVIPMDATMGFNWGKMQVDKETGKVTNPIGMQELELGSISLAKQIDLIKEQRNGNS